MIEIVNIQSNMTATEFREQLDALMKEAVDSGLLSKSVFIGPKSYKCMNCINCNDHEFAWFFSLNRDEGGNPICKKEQ